MDGLSYLPPITVLLRALRISLGRLDGTGRVAVPARVLRALLQVAAAGQAFSPEFYRASYPDVRSSETAGLIPDLHRHFFTAGYFEGRLGAPPGLDAEFYLRSYPDVAAGITADVVDTADEHYLRTGAAEGRAPNAALSAAIEAWAALLREPSVPED